MAGVGVLTLLIGTGTAWLVTMYRFPGRGAFPMAAAASRSPSRPTSSPMPIWRCSIIPACVQTALRAMFGWRDAKDYWFPDIRSLGGAILVMSAVLYPYVYITARASFIAQSVCVLEVSRTLGRNAAETFWQVALPLARPALAAGVALALMETLNDIGAVEFFGVRTLTVAVYDTWLDRNSLAGAAQIACVMLAFVVALLLLERAIRAKRRFHHTTGNYRDLPEETLQGARGVLAAIACAVPVLLGFVLPGSVLVHDALAPCGGGARAGVLGGGGQQPSARRLRRRTRGRLRRGSRLCPPADALEADPGLKHGSCHLLRGPRHGARHRAPHSARRPGQRRRRRHAVAVRGLDRAACSRAPPSRLCSPTPFASSPPRSAPSRRA